MNVNDIVANIIFRVGDEVGSFGEGFIVNALNDVYKQYNDEYELIKRNFYIDKGSFNSDKISNTAIQINVSASAKTFTRVSGDFVTDGFLPGGIVRTKGFTNSGNNGIFKVISVTALIITIDGDYGDSLALVDETGSGDEIISSEAKNYVFFPNDFLRPYKIPYDDNLNYKYIHIEDFNKNFVRKFTFDSEKIYFTNVNSSTELNVHYISSGKTLKIIQPGDILAPGETNVPEWQTNLHRILVYETAMGIKPNHKLIQPDTLSLSTAKENIIRQSQGINSSESNVMDSSRPYTKPFVDDYREY